MKVHAKQGRNVLLINKLNTETVDFSSKCKTTTVYKNQ